MANGELSIAAAALGIALTALVIAVGQLLQQLFSTAEGFRRCQPSVLGAWAQKTRLCWRWSQFRFEVRFTTPEIVLQPNVEFRNAQKVVQRSQTALFTVPVDHKMDDSALVQIRRQSDDNTNLVCWINLLKQLELLQQSTWNQLEPPLQLGATGKLPTHISNEVVSPAMVLREWSWDFMPPEALRPFATTTVGTLVVLAHRLGMVWRDLQPSTGIMRAEGNGHQILSTPIRGFGIVIQYTYDDSYMPDMAERHSYQRIPTAAADKIGCGIIPGCTELELPDLPVIPQSPSDTRAKMAAIGTALRGVGLSEATIKEYSDSKDIRRCLYDLFYMYSPFLPLHNSKVVDIFNPYGPEFEYHDGVLRTREARIIIHGRLRAFISSRNHRTANIEAVLGHLEKFSSSYGFHFYNSWGFESPPKYRYPLPLLAQVHAGFDETTAFFQSLQSKHSIRYTDIIGAHLTLAPQCVRQARSNIDSGNSRDDETLVKGARSQFFIELSHCYVDEVDAFVDLLAEKGFKDKELAVDAWWMLMLRALYFAGPIVVMPVTSYPTVPSAFHGSRMPIYIT